MSQEWNASLNKSACDEHWETTTMILPMFIVSTPDFYPEDGKTTWGFRGKCLLRCMLNPGKGGDGNFISVLRYECDRAKARMSRTASFDRGCIKVAHVSRIQKLVVFDALVGWL